MREWWGADVVPRIRWKIEILEGEEIPGGYGISHYVVSTRRAVCYPLPINLIVGALRALGWHLRCPAWRLAEYRSSLFDRRLDAAFHAGVSAGWLAHGGYDSLPPKLRR